MSEAARAAANHQGRRTKAHFSTPDRQADNLDHAQIKVTYHGLVIPTQPDEPRKDDRG